MLRKLQKERGASSIEFLALMPLFIVMALMVWQLAVAGYAILTTQAAARDGVRVAATTKSESAAEQAVYHSFGAENTYYQLDEVSVSIGDSEAQVTVRSSIHTILLPEKVRIPFPWTVKAPIFEDKYGKL